MLRYYGFITLAFLTLSACARTVVLPAEDADAVTEWTLEADRLGHGGANWHTLAIMHRAMHDAANAADPHYARWAAAAADEPQHDAASVPAGAHHKTWASGLIGGGEAGQANEPFFACMLLNIVPLPFADDPR